MRLLFGVVNAADNVKHESDQPYMASLINHNVYVAIGPLVTSEAAYDATDVIYHLSQTNLNLALLESKKTLLTQITDADLKLRHPILQLSAGVGGQLYNLPTFTPNAAGNVRTAGLNLEGNEIDFNAIITPWVNSFVAISNDSDNISLALSSGFLTIGNLNASPIYFSLGEMNVPFAYSPTALSTAALPASMMTINTPTVLLGYSKNNFMAAIYGYTGSEVVGGSSPIPQAGAETYYTLFFGENAQDSCKIGVGVLTNVADAGGFQNTYYATNEGQFGGFDQSGSSNNLAHSVSGGDINVKILAGRWKFMAEYVASLRQFSVQDLSFDNHGAAPQAARIEARYSPAFIPKKHGAFIGAAWDHTMQALELNFEKNKYAFFFNVAIWRATGFKLEYDRQQDYGTSQTGSGLGATAPIIGTDKGINAVSVELWVYF
ncbi:MAG: LbtU family siderophore porin [Coxiellaceae bacterium]|nr:LbtU family siderophore porin [Coxiellaceae bacterium]